MPGKVWKWGAYRKRTLISFDFALFLRIIVSRPSGPSVFLTHTIPRDDDGLTHDMQFRAICVRAGNDIYTLSKLGLDSEISYLVASRRGEKWRHGGAG